MDLCVRSSILREVDGVVSRNRRLLQSIPRIPRKNPQKNPQKQPQKRKRVPPKRKRVPKREKTMREEMKSHWQGMEERFEKETVQLETVFSEAEECSICMEDMTRKCKLKTTDCLHVFHEKCISEWLERSKICPFCRSEIK